MADRITAAVCGLGFMSSLLSLLDQIRGRDGILRLTEMTGADAGEDRPFPRLSVVVAARNEEQTVRAGVPSILAQDYPELEVVLIDDRSTDRTGAVLAELAAAHPDRARVLTVDALPPGWLGKNHALWLGAQAASGEWLLFTDADVVLAPTTLRRAVIYSRARGVDHLCIPPRIPARGYWLDAFVSFFITAFTLSQRPYRAYDPKSKASVGVGAFNLMRRAAYERAGTYAAVSLRPDDDVRFGKRIKRLGMRQQVMEGADLVSVEWYPSLGAAIKGLEKNAFAGLDYSVPKTVGSVVALLLLLVFPYLVVWRASGRTRALAGAVVALHTANFVYANRQAGRDVAAQTPAFPVAVVLLAYAFARSAWLTLRRRGIRWRDTFYPLDELKLQTGLEGT